MSLRIATYSNIQILLLDGLELFLQRILLLCGGGGALSGGILRALAFLLEDLLLLLIGFLFGGRVASSRGDAL